MKPTCKILQQFAPHSGIVYMPAYEIPDEVARQLFDASVYAHGAGWSHTADGIEVYGIDGTHRNGYKGWIVHSFGGLR